MTRARSRPPVGRLAQLSDLGAIGKSLGENNGESRRVCRLEEYPNLIFKEYQKPATLERVRQLTRLIELPAQMTAAERTLLDEHTSWPTTRVTNAEHQTIGVLMPLAPDTFSISLQDARVDVPNIDHLKWTFSLSLKHDRLR